MNNNLVTVLRNTLSNDNDERRNAEQTLFQYSQQPAYANNLFNVMGMHNTDDDIRFAAVTSLKYFIKIVWKEEGESGLSEEDRKVIRQQTIDTICTAPPAIVRQITEALRIIASADFPDVWPRFVVALQQYANDADDAFRLFSFIAVLDDLCMNYRHELKSNQLWLGIKLVLEKIFMPLTQLFVAYSNGTPMDASRIANLTKMVSVYHSLLAQDLPEIVKDNLKPWMDTFTTLFSLLSDTFIWFICEFAIKNKVYKLWFRSQSHNNVDVNIICDC